MEKHLKISEDFYSVQGEGPSTGIPAYFIRLQNCNFCCGDTWKHVNEVKNLGENAITSGSFKGKLEDGGKATWTCDSIPVWVHGHKKPMDYLIGRWDEEKILDMVLEGRCHLIWTGGEPTLPQNQTGINDFISHLDNWGEMNDRHVYAYHEIETNGSLVIEDELFVNLDQINCSAKLANSGMAADKRINPEAIEIIKNHPNYNFKFVVSSEEDIVEAFETYVYPFEIPVENVCMMPGLDNRHDFHKQTNFILEMAKKYGFRGLQRLHISAWGEVTGV